MFVNIYCIDDVIILTNSASDWRNSSIKGALLSEYYTYI
jgi:hypothetical protein